MGEPVSVGRGNIPSVSLWICRLKRHSTYAVKAKNQACIAQA